MFWHDIGKNIVSNTNKQEESIMKNIYKMILVIAIAMMGSNSFNL